MGSMRNGREDEDCAVTWKSVCMTNSPRPRVWGCYMSSALYQVGSGRDLAVQFSAIAGRWLLASRTVGIPNPTFAGRRHMAFGNSRLTIMAAAVIVRIMNAACN